MAAWSLYRRTWRGDEWRADSTGTLVQCREIRRYKSKAAAVHAATKHHGSSRIFAAKTHLPPWGRRPRRTQ